MKWSENIMISNYAVGQEVYFKSYNSNNVTRGIIEDIGQKVLCTHPLKVHTTIFVKVPDYSEYMSDTIARSPANLFYTEEDCNRQILIDKGDVDMRQVYRSEINSIKDLMVFIFTHDIVKHPNNVAYTVAYEKASELLGIDLQSLLGAIEV